MPGFLLFAGIITRMSSEFSRPPRKGNFANQAKSIDPAIAQLRVPPHSIEAEQSVLGGLLLDNESLDRITDLLTEADFYRSEHKLIFQQITRLLERAKPADVVTVSEAIEQAGLTDETGGLAYLGELAKNTPSVANIKAYAQIIRERATLRKLIGISNEIADSAYAPEGRTGEEILDEAERKIFEIAEDRPKTGGPVGINDILVKAIDRIDELFNNGDAITGLSTGFDDLDNLTSGLQPADMIIVAGRPSMGKTTFAMNLVENALMRSDKAILVYSLEMPSESIVIRMLASLGRIDQTKVRAGQLDDDDWPRLTSAVNLLNDRKLFIDDTAGISPSEMRARTRRLAREHGEIGLIMVDYLQLMQIPGSSGDSRVTESSEISRSLKGLAKEFNCPVIALSQLNRGLEQRPNKRPINSDLRESGAIEQDADIILFVYRDEVYHPETEYKGVAEIIIGKQRNGPLGTARLAFLGKYSRFENLAPGSYQFDDD